MEKVFRFPADSIVSGRSPPEDPVNAAMPVFPPLRGDTDDLDPIFPEDALDTPSDVLGLGIGSAPFTEG
jgi:hypothetical protein